MTLIGINVPDTYHLSSWHGIINYSRKYDKKLSVLYFCWNIVTSADPPMWTTKPQWWTSFFEWFWITIITGNNSYNPRRLFKDINLFTYSTGCRVRRENNSEATWRCNSKLYFLVKYDTTTDPSGRKRSKARPCKLCKEKGSRKDTIYYCISCGLVFVMIPAMIASKIMSWASQDKQDLWA